MAVADAAHAAGVAHLVYSSANAVGPVPTGVGHFDTKARIEEHVRALPTPATIIRPAAFMEILLLPGAGLPDGRFSFLARPDQAMQFIAARDVGRVVAQVFADPARWAGRTLEVAGDALTGDALAAVLAGHLGRPVEYGRIPDDVLARDPLLGRLAALVDDGRLAGRADLDALRVEFPFLLRFEDWLAGPVPTSSRRPCAPPAVVCPCGERVRHHRAAVPAAAQHERSGGLPRTRVGSDAGQGRAGPDPGGVSRRRCRARRCRRRRG